MTPSKRRSPNGMQSDKPVPVRFTHEEKRELIEFADEENRSQASMARQIYRLGLALYKTTRGLK